MRKEEAIVATATASRAWQSTSEEKVDVPRIRAMEVSQAQSVRCAQPPISVVFHVPMIILRTFSAKLLSEQPSPP
jgi:hypothetical protein